LSQSESRLLEEFANAKGIRGSQQGEHLGHWFPTWGKLPKLGNWAF